MKFSITHSFLAISGVGALYGRENGLGHEDRKENRRVSRNVSTNDNINDGPFWNSFVQQDLDSMATPTMTPIDPTSDPTPAPNETTIVPSIPACESIEEILCSVPEFSTLCDFVGTTGLENALKEDVFTIFAPVNNAFESIPEDVANTLTDADILREVILYHAVPEIEILAENLVCDASLMMASSEETTTICTGDEIFQVGIGNTPDALPRIIALDGKACNGIIHAIDQVMLQSVYLPVDPTPVPDIPTPVPSDPAFDSTSPILETNVPTPTPSDSTIETASPSLGSTSINPKSDVPTTPTPSDFTIETTSPSLGSTSINDPPPVSDTCETITQVVCNLPEFKILCKLVADADLGGVLGDEDQLTLFAPTNSAFESLPLELADAVISNAELLTNLLLSHVVSGIVFSTDLECGGEISMVSGEETTTICNKDQIYQTGAGNTIDAFPVIIAPDGIACNGVIHAIDHAILPSLDS